jgi:uncharacterized protein (DUF1330 family)
MAVYLVGAIEINDKEQYQVYQRGAATALAAFPGVKLISVDDNPAILEGTRPANHLFIIEFVSSEQLHSFYASTAYQAVIGHRHAAADTKFIMAMRGSS